MERTFSDSANPDGSNYLWYGDDDVLPNNKQTHRFGEGVAVRWAGKEEPLFVFAIFKDDLQNSGGCPRLIWKVRRFYSLRLSQSNKHVASIWQ
mmetsp:Transcript_59268/g.176107  ORF Transcript_59268/g.176107 Transcript_59268/m.176107 type:complete len:93 (+) Transcript_59268:204-482(+)